MTFSNEHSNYGRKVVQFCNQAIYYDNPEIDDHYTDEIGSDHDSMPSLIDDNDPWRSGNPNYDHHDDAMDTTGIESDHLEDALTEIIDDDDDVEERYRKIMNDNLSEGEGSDEEQEIASDVEVDAMHDIEDSLTGGSHRFSVSLDSTSCNSTNHRAYADSLL